LNDTLKITNQFMEIALKEAKLAKERDEIPVGAVIIDKNNNILASNGNRVIAVESNDIVKAFGTATGAIIWEQDDLKLRKLTSPASISNLVVVGDLEGYVHLLNAQSGNFEGREKVSRNAITEIISQGNYLLIADSAGRVQKFSIK
jgi:outer membrane protein assembly factor BamB